MANVEYIAVAGKADADGENLKFISEPLGTLAEARDALEGRAMPIQRIEVIENGRHIYDL